MLLLPGPRGRKGPQRSGEYRLRACGLTDRLVASYTFDEGTGTVLNDRRGWAPRFLSDQIEISGAGFESLNGIYYRAYDKDTIFWRKADNHAELYWWIDEGYGPRWNISPNGTVVDDTIYMGASTDRRDPTSVETWTAVDPADEPVPTVAGAGMISQVVSPPLDGTLTGFTSDYAALVTGGSFSNTVFTPSGTEYGRTKYISPDGNTKLSYWYMMDPEMDGAWYIWAATGSEPWMDGYLSYKSGTGDAWGGTYSSSYTVAQGDLQPGPWFADGLEFSGGYVVIDTTDAVEPGTGDFSVCVEYIYNKPTTADVGTIFEWIGGGKTIRLQRWYSDPYFDAPFAHLYMTDGVHSVTADFPAASAGMFTNGKLSRAVITFQRSGNATLHVDGKYVGATSISSVNGSFSGMGKLYIGSSAAVSHPPTWAFKGKFRRTDIINRALSAAEAAAWSGNTWQVFAQPRLPLMAFTDGSAPAATGAYYYRYLTSLWTEA